MTLFDYVVLTILLASIIVSTVRGLVKEILSLIAWLAAFVVANLYAEKMAVLLPEHWFASLPGGMARLMIAFAILFIATLLLLGFVNLAIGYLIKAAGLTFADRGLGGLFGLARGVVIILTLVILAGFTALPKQAFWHDALFRPFAEQALHLLKPLLPPAWAQYIRV